LGLTIIFAAGVIAGIVGAVILLVLLQIVILKVVVCWYRYKSPKFIFYVLQNVILLQLIGIPTRGSEWAYFRLLRICLVRPGWVTVFGWIYRLRM